MANRTYKMMGDARSSTEALNVVLSVGGAEVYNGSVTAANTAYDGTSDNITELFTFELDDGTTGDTSWSCAVTGPVDGVLVLQYIWCNLVEPDVTIATSWFKSASHFSGNYSDSEKSWIVDDIPTAEEQASIATNLPGLDSAILTRLNAGNSTQTPDGDAILDENMLATVNADHYYILWAGSTAGYDNAGINDNFFKSIQVATTRDSVQIDGEAYSLSAGEWPPVHAGTTLTMTQDLTPPTVTWNAMATIDIGRTE